MKKKLLKIFQIFFYTNFYESFTSNFSRLKKSSEEILIGFFWEFFESFFVVFVILLKPFRTIMPTRYFKDLLSLIPLNAIIFVVYPLLLFFSPFRCILYSNRVLRSIPFHVDVLCKIQFIDVFCGNLIRNDKKAWPHLIKIDTVNWMSFI